MKFLEFFKKLFKKKEEKKLILSLGLPPIQERVPLVSPTPLQLTPQTEEDSALINKYMKSCAVCTYAMHDPGLGELKEVICTLDPNKPVVKPVDDTCLQHESKYKKLKIIVDKAHLMEYDSDKAMSLKKDNIPDKAIVQIGEDQWQQ